MLKLPVLKFLNEACLHSPTHEQSSFTFYTNTIPQQRYLFIQHSTTSRWIISIHIASSRGRSGWQEVNRDINTITGANSVQSRRVNGLYIQDMGNPFIIHHQPGEEIVLLIGFDIPYALQRSLRQRKRTLE